MKIKKIIIMILSLFTLISCSFPSNNKELNQGELKFDTVRTYIGYKDLPSTGSPKMLVIPVVFSDCSLNEDQLEIEHDNITKTFIGDSEDTYWESVKSFYHKSSYGRLSLDIKISPYCYLDYSIYEASLAINEGVEPTYNILTDACLWYASNFDDYNSFDSNYDGLIDSVWLIYMEDYNSEYYLKNPSHINEYNLNQFLWAYTYWYIGRWDNKAYRKPFAYAWASYKFLHEAPHSNGTDGHTFIHETGHLLGLEDYYSYDYNPTGSLTSDKTKPTGALDMMDNNVYDHNAYSKYLLDWIDPIEVSDGTYTLSSFQENGDALIIRTSDNNSSMDEYLIIEYFTPTGLNELDANTAYTSHLDNRFTEPGFKIYHADSRLGVYEYTSTGLDFVEYYEDYSSFYEYGRKHIIQIANSNTPSRSAYRGNKLLCLISSLGKSRLYFKGGLNVTAQNKDLFQKGDSLSSFEFNTYNDEDLYIEILESNENNGVIRFSGVGK